MFYGVHGHVENIRVKGISFGSRSSVVDQNMNLLIALLHSINEGIDALRIRNVQLLKTQVSLRELLQDLRLWILTQSRVSDGHNDMPVPSGNELFNECEPNALVAASHDNIPQPLHCVFDLDIYSQ